MQKLEHLQTHFATLLADRERTGPEIWAVFRDMARQLVEWPGDESGDSLLITFGYETLARERVVLKLVRQFLAGSADELSSGWQMQLCLFYSVDDRTGRQVKALQPLTHLGSWAFPNRDAYLDYAENLPAFQELLANAKPLHVDVRLENLLH
jgi:hypothetical protein